MTLLQNWKYTETKLAERRKYLAEKGVKDGGLEDTMVDQKMNNKKYDNIMKKGQYRRTLANFA